MCIALVLLQAAATPPASPILSGALPIVLMVAIFVFLVYMPMRRQQKAQKEMIRTLTAGQTVLTTGGIIGTIMTVNDDSLILRIKPDNLKIQVARSAVSSLVGTDEPLKK